MAALVNAQTSRLLLRDLVLELAILQDQIRDVIDGQRASKADWN